MSELRILAALFTVIFAAVAVSSGREWRKNAGNFDRWQASEPTRESIDLSRVGVTDVPFNHTCNAAHGALIWLEASDATEASVADLRSTMRILDAQGKTVVDGLSLFDRSVGSSFTRPNAVQLAYVSQFDCGRYTLRFDVTTPAASLAGRPQTVVANYFLCGLERLPEQLPAVGMWGFGVPALLVGSVTSVDFARFGWRRRPRR